MITLLIMPDQNPTFPTEEAPAAPFGQVKEPASIPTPPEAPQGAAQSPTWSGTAPAVKEVAEETPLPALNALPTTPPETVSQPQVPVIPAPPTAATPPGRRFPIKIVIGIIVTLVLAALAFFGYKFLMGRTPKTPLTQNTIVWWGLWEDASIVTPLIEEYQAQNPSVKIEYKRESPKDYRERLESSLAKGDGPDIFFFHNTWVPMFKDKLDKIPTGVMSAGEYAQTFYPVVSSDVTSGTGLVGIPLGYDALTLYINQDIFDAAGKTPPETWDELREVATDLTIKDEDGVITQSGVALGLTSNVDHWPEILALMMLQNGVNLAQPTGELAEKALEFYTLFAKEELWDENLPNSTVAFAAQKVAMVFAPSWRAFEIKQQNPDLRFKAVAPPHLPKEDPGEPDIAYATYWVQGVWEGSSKKTEAWNFLKFMSQKASLEKLFANAAKSRLFGEPYPRVDMAELLSTHPLVGSIATQAPNATSWYLASRTFDGATGINSQINKYFEDAVNAVNEGKTSKASLEVTAEGVAQILAQFDISSP